MKKDKRLHFFVALSILATILLSILPIPIWAVPFWPLWPLLALVYWGLAVPDKYGIKLAWFVGILMDLVKHTLIGQHALTYLITAYTITHLYPRLRIHSLLQQSLSIGVLLIPYFFLNAWIDGMLYSKGVSWQQWTPIIGSAVVWPWIFSMLRLVRHNAL